jgi:preprotein translocase subunit SecG
MSSTMIQIVAGVLFVVILIVLIQRRRTRTK